MLYELEWLLVAMLGLPQGWKTHPLLFLRRVAMFIPGTSAYRV